MGLTFDLKNGSTILEFQLEWRSVYHYDFMRPLVNRWPIISEPLSDQAEVTADFADFPKFCAGKQKSSKAIKGTC